MFNCQGCKKTVGPGIPARKVVVETRAKQYHNVFYKEDDYGNRERHEVDSQGYETVREWMLCGECAG